MYVCMYVWIYMCVWKLVMISIFGPHARENMISKFQGILAFWSQKHSNDYQTDLGPLPFPYSKINVISVQNPCLFWLAIFFASENRICAASNPVLVNEYPSFSGSNPTCVGNAPESFFCWWNRNCWKNMAYHQFRGFKS